MKKATLVAMAAAIVAMFAIPGSASAAWIKHHNPLAAGENVELELTTTDFFFEGEVGGITCNSMISRALLEGGKTTGKFNSSQVEGNVTANCQGKGITAGCEVHEATADNLPSTIHTVSTDTLSITFGTLTYTTSGFLCPHTPSLTPGTVCLSIAAGQTNTTSTGTLSGTLSGDGPAQNVEVGGTMHVLGTITYGF